MLLSLDFHPDVCDDRLQSLHNYTELFHNEVKGKNKQLWRHVNRTLYILPLIIGSIQYVMSRTIK